MKIDKSGFDYESGLRGRCQRHRAIVKNRYFSKFKFQNFVQVARSGFQWEVRLRYFCWTKTTSAQLMCTITAPEKPNFHVWCCEKDTFFFSILV
jgi:hypothetical protein